MAETEIVKLVVYSEVPAYLRRGWIITSRPEDMRHHADYGVIMEFTYDRRSN